MWRNAITTGSAAVAVWALGASLAEAHGIFGLRAWPPVWGTAVLVEALSEDAPVADGCPIESADGLSLFIASNRVDPPGGPAEPNDIWVSDRASIGAPWQPPRRLEGPINLPGIGDFCPTPIRGR
jgi:hypothetical protein